MRHKRLERAQGGVTNTRTHLPLLGVEGREGTIKLVHDELVGLEDGIMQHLPLLIGQEVLELLRRAHRRAVVC